MILYAEDRRGRGHMPLSYTRSKVHFVLANVNALIKRSLIAAQLTLCCVVNSRKNAYYISWPHRNEQLITDPAA